MVERWWYYEDVPVMVLGLRRDEKTCCYERDLKEKLLALRSHHDMICRKLPRVLTLVCIYLLFASTHLSANNMNWSVWNVLLTFCLSNT
jgi:hypothetical protein